MTEGYNRSTLDGRVAMISGATKNIGLATARLFAASGAELLITARTASTLDEVASELQALGAPRVVPVAGDIGDLDHIAHLADTALSEFGGVDVLVNNALVDMGKQPTIDTPSSVWAAGLSGYIEGPLTLIRALRGSLAERGHGSIVNLVSTAGFTPVGDLGAYGIMKAAMMMMTRYLAAELAPEIRVNAVCPGTTSSSGDPGSNDRWNRVLPLVPLKRMATPDETAQSILFLATDASSYTTGDVIFVDGGRVNAGLR